MQRLKALQYIAAMRAAFPEVLQAIKTHQLSQEMLLFKETYLAELGKTGDYANSAIYVCPAIF